MLCGGKVYLRNGRCPVHTPGHMEIVALHPQSTCPGFRFPLASKQAFGVEGPATSCELLQIHTHECAAIGEPLPSRRLPRRAQAGSRPLSPELCAVRHGSVLCVNSPLFRHHAVCVPFKTALQSHSPLDHPHRTNASFVEPLHYSLSCAVLKQSPQIHRHPNPETRLRCRS